MQGKTGENQETPGKTGEKSGGKNGGKIRKNRGKTWGKTGGKPRKILGKPRKKTGKNHEKIWEKLGKKNQEKIWEKSRQNQENIQEKTGEKGKTRENPGKIPGVANPLGMSGLQLQNSKSVIHAKDAAIQELKERVSYLEAEVGPGILGAESKLGSFWNVGIGVGLLVGVVGELEMGEKQEKCGKRQGIKT